MKNMNKAILLASVAGTLLFGTTSAMAQRQGGGGGGNFDPEQMRQRMAEMYQERLGVSADELKVIQPLIEDVQTKQRAVGGGGFGAMFGRGRGQGGGGGGGGDQAAGGGRRGGFGTPSPEAEALQKAVESGTPAEIKAKLEAYRDARKKNTATLQEAREKLRKVVTPKQEAALVMMNVLD